MRNDAHDDLDDLDELPILSNERIEPQLNTAKAHSAPPLDNLRAAPAYSTAKRSSNKAIGMLSALTLAIFCATAAFGWWSMQRMQLLEQQLVATQNSFSKISEDAAGRINAITGKVSATESSVLSGNEALKLRLNNFENSAVETHKQQQIHLDEHRAHLTKLNAELKTLTERNTSLNKTITEQKSALAQQGNTLSALQTDLSKKIDSQQQQLLAIDGTLKTNQQQLLQLDEFKTRLKSISTELAAVQKNTSSKDDITRIQQDILILRSELEQRPSAAPASNSGPSLADFDAYRVQTHRTITALQEQVRNLQKNTP